jgi:F0F1-type ATP synthase assembly protein I
MSDLTPPVEKPVTVRASAIPEQTLTLIRYVLVMLGGIFVSKGWLSDSDLNALIGALLIILPTIVGIVKDKRNQAVQVTLAKALPDEVARVE